jgi:hypothetical protein
LPRLAPARSAVSRAQAKISENGDIRLGLGVLAEDDGVLHPHDGATGQTRGQELVEVAGERHVAAADGRHLDDLAPDQLDPVVFAEDARLGHPIVLRPAEAPSCRRHLDCHGTPPGSSRLIAQRIAAGSAA